MDGNMGMTMRCGRDRRKTGRTGRVARWIVLNSSFCLPGIAFSGLATAQEAPLQTPPATAEQPVAGQPVAGPNSKVTGAPHLPSDQIARVFAKPKVFANPNDADRNDAGRDQANRDQADRDTLADSKTEPNDPNRAADVPANSERLSDGELAEAIEQLGSGEFAVRERATARLRQLGKPALAALRLASDEHPDLEVRLRAKDVADGIVSGEVAGRIDQFLAGDDVPLPGWSVAQEILGDNVRLRELYVDLLLRHEKIADALAGSSKDRAEALQTAIVQIQRGMFVERRLPTEADALGLLLLANDHEMPLGRVDEEALFSILRREPTAKLMKDPSTSGPFRALLGGWLMRDDPGNAQELLWFSMGWDLTESLPLAIRTIEQAVKQADNQNTDAVTISMAAQAISRFGQKRDAEGLAGLLGDARPVSEQQYVSGALVQAQVRDAAAAAIVLLNDRPLSEFGFNEDAKHPKYGFIPQEIGFPTDNPKPRETMLEKVREAFIAEQPKPDADDA